MPDLQHSRSSRACKSAVSSKPWLYYRLSSLPLTRKNPRLRLWKLLTVGEELLNIEIDLQFLRLEVVYG